MRSDSWQVERDFVPATLEEAAELRRAIITAGHGPAVASAIVGWLLEKSHEGIDRSGQPTRARYRRVLASLNGSYPGPRPRKRADVTPPLLRRRRSEAPELEAA